MRFALTYLTALLTLACSSLALTPWEQIHQTIDTYPLAIDRKDFGLLSQVFTPTAFANYTGPLSNLTGLPAIQSGLAASVATVGSQHLLGTTVIDIHPSGSTANSTTYFQASLFGLGKALGQVVYLYGYYADDLVRMKGKWLIDSRELVFQGPYIGNTSLLGG